MNAVFSLFFTFAYLGLISLGGAMATVPEMERQIVLVHNWMNHQDFVNAIALGLFVPGPNMLYVLHIGNKVAGLPGAVAAGLGMFGPTSILLAGVASLAGKSNPPPWVKHFHAICGPITIGLMGAAAWNLGQNLGGDISGMGICLLAALLTARRLLDPAWIVISAATFGIVQAFFLST